MSAASTNVAITALGAATSFMLAHGLGAAGRGTYGAILSYVMFAAAIGDCGLSTAICFRVAQSQGSPVSENPVRIARDVIRTGGIILFSLGCLAGAAGLGLAPVIVGGEPGAVTAFVIASAALPMVCGKACWIFALQACSQSLWNIVRVSQTVTYTALVVTFSLVHHLSPLTTIFCLLGSLAVQTVLAALACRTVLPARGHVRRDIAGALLRYGWWSFTGALPFLLNAYLDVLLLALLVGPADLGHYVVALSLANLCNPLCVSFGNAALPRLARKARPDGDVQDIRRVALLAVAGSLAVGLLVVPLVCIGAPVIVHILLGDAFNPTVPLLWLLAPGAVVIGCNQVMGDILRGLDRARAVARCEGVGLVLTLAGLGLFVPIIGVSGAAAVSSVTYLLNFVLLSRAVSRAVGGIRGAMGTGIRRLLGYAVVRVRTVLAG